MRAAIILIMVGAAGQSLAESPAQAQMDFANGLFIRGFHEEAAEEYRNYLDDYPDGEHVDAALFRLAEASSSHGD